MWGLGVSVSTEGPLAAQGARFKAGLRVQGRVQDSTRPSREREIDKERERGRERERERVGEREREKEGEVEGSNQPREASDTNSSKGGRPRTIYIRLQNHLVPEL